MTDFLNLVSQSNLALSSELKNVEVARSIMDQSGINKKIFKLGRMEALIANPSKYFADKKKALEDAANEDTVKKALKNMADEFRKGGLSKNEALQLAAPVIAANLAAQSAAIQLQFPSTSSLSSVDQIINRVALTQGGPRVI